MNEFAEMMGASIILLAIFGGIASPLIVLIISLFCYLKKRLEHKQVMAAIEKGMPYPIKTQQVGPAWIKNLTAGIAMLIIGIGIAVILFYRVCARGLDPEARTGFFVAVVFFAIGISLLIRGLLQRKVQNQNNGSNDTAEPVSLPGGTSHQ